MNTEIITEKFTPGPWQFLFGQTPASVDSITVPPDVNEFDRKGWRSKTISIGGPEGKCFADIKAYTTEGFLQDFDEWEANAKLIAAAPEMYAVLKELYDWSINNNVRGPIFPKLEAALKKATE